jgi:Zn-dependent metalloprotease
VNEHRDLFGHDGSALERAVVKRDYVTEHNGMRTTVWQQEHEGIEVFEAVFLAHTTKDGELVNVTSQFVPDEARAAANGGGRKHEIRKSKKAA